MIRAMVLSLWLAYGVIGCDSGGPRSPDDRPNFVEHQEPLDPLSVAVSIQSHPQHPESGEAVSTAVEDFMLTNYPHVTIVEREKLKEMLAEKNLQESDLFSQEAAAEVGKLLRADVVIVGRVVTWQNLSSIKPPISLGPIPITGPRPANACNVEFNMRSVEVGTAKRMFSVNVADNGSSYGEACASALDEKRVKASLDAGLRRRTRASTQPALGT